jgi:alpha-D-ribose 1-methylphosphonate 5-triphosphate synthase subunit PhnH
MLAAADVLEGGFSDPVLESQSVFRALMNGMARPASIARIQSFMVPPAPLGLAAGAIACTLIDADTPFWLDAALDSDDVKSWLAFHTGGQPATSIVEAAFAVVSAPFSMPAFDRFAQGSQEYPDRSATLILQLESLEGGEQLSFKGPGIKSRAVIAPLGLPGDFAAQWSANRKRFPRGVDLVLAAGDVFACLPRSAVLIPAEG